MDGQEPEQSLPILSAQQKREDKELLAKWYRLHPPKPWRGQNGGGGFIGWANRLDERAGMHRQQRWNIPVSGADMTAELPRAFKTVWVWLFIAAAVIVGITISVRIGLQLAGIGIVTQAAFLAQKRRRQAMKAELAALADAGDDPQRLPTNK